MKEQQQIISVDFQGIFEVNKQLQAENSKLKTQLEYERKLRLQAESELLNLQSELPQIKKRKTPEEKAKLLSEQQERQRTGLTSAGKPLARKADSIMSYTEFENIRQALKNSHTHKNKGEMYACIWALGIAMGLRCSDVVKLKWCDIFDENLQWKEMIKLSDKKTGKKNEFRSTDAIRIFIHEYVDSCKIQINLNDYLFKSQKKSKNGQSYPNPSTVWKVITEFAQPLITDGRHVGTHTMRHSCGTIIQCLWEEDIKVNQGTHAAMLTLNHGSQRTTRLYRDMDEKEKAMARQIVSDFLLGKKGDKLELPNSWTDDDYNKFNEFIYSEIL